jgi:hypothetical protein
VGLWLIKNLYPPHGFEIVPSSFGFGKFCQGKIPGSPFKQHGTTQDNIVEVRQVLRSSVKPMFVLSEVKGLKALSCKCTFGMGFEVFFEICGLFTAAKRYNGFDSPGAVF